MDVRWAEISRDEFMAVYDHMLDSWETAEWFDRLRMQTIVVLRDRKSNLPVLQTTVSEITPTKFYINGELYDDYSKTD